MEVNRIILYDQLIQKKADKEGEKQNKKKNRCNKQKTAGMMLHFNPNIATIIKYKCSEQAN